MLSDAHLLERLYVWQTLISGIFAMLAALFTIRVLNKQILLAAKQETERRTRRARAIRSTLPLALSEMTGLMHQIVGDLREIAALGQDSNLSKAVRSHEFKQPSAESISILKEMIEFSDSENIIKILTELISQNQILLANLRSARDSKDLLITKNNLKYYVCIAIKIYALSAILFPYARAEADEVEIDSFGKQCEVAVLAFSIVDYQFPGIMEAARNLEPFRAGRR